MRTLVFRKHVVGIIVAIIIACLPGVAAYGQNVDQILVPNPSGATSAGTTNQQTTITRTITPGSTTDNSQALRNFLQNRPEVMDQLKLLLMQRLRSEGSLVDEQTVSDQAVYERLQNDLDFRQEALRSLVDLGYISEDDARNLMGNEPNGPMTAEQGEPRENLPPGTIYPSPTTTGVQPGTTETTGVTRRQGERPMTTRPEPRYDDSALNPKTLPKKNPYPGLPSARDLYTQFPEQTKPLKRFGSDIFRPDVVGMSNFPMDLPAGSDYVLGPGDTVTINIWGGVTQRISRSGRPRRPSLAARHRTGCGFRLDPGAGAEESYRRPWRRSTTMPGSICR